MSQPTDLYALLIGVAGRDRHAFKQLYHAAGPKLFGIALRIVRDRDVAEDVVQDVFEKVWANARVYSGERGRPMTWLISITRHRAIDVVRRRSEARAVEMPDGSDWLATIADPRDHEGQIMDADRLGACLGRLGDEQRRCFVDAYRDGLSREELAERFGRPVPTIKTWLHRSAQSLRVCLDELS